MKQIVLTVELPLDVVKDCYNLRLDGNPLMLTRQFGSIILFFTISGILYFPIELFVKAIPKVLFLHFKKINVIEAKILFVVSLVMALLCMNDVIENKDK